MDQIDDDSVYENSSFTERVTTGNRHDQIHNRYEVPFAGKNPCHELHTEQERKGKEDNE